MLSLRRHRLACRTTPWAVFILMSALLGTTAFAQQPARRYKPLKGTIPVGEAGKWAVTVDPTLYGHCQEVRVDIPGNGLVTWYDQGTETAAHATPAQAGLLVGAVYRFKLSGMPDYPGAELYPTVELISRLHPPPGKELQYPVPLAFTDDEIRLAMSGRMVTKVVFVQQPDLPTIDPDNRDLPTLRASADVDALAAADDRGRPIAILRLGGRSKPQGPAGPEFFGTGAPVRLMVPGETRTVPVSKTRPKTEAALKTASHKTGPRLEAPRMNVRIDANGVQ